MAPIKQDSDLYTADEFYALIPDGQKADLIDGAIYLGSPDTLPNDDVNAFLLSLMRMFAKARGLGHVTGSRYAYRLSEHRAPEPDVAFVALARCPQVLTTREGVGPPDVAVEVVSRDSRSRDYGEKKDLYENSGVQEYWLIDLMKGRCEFYCLVDGHYELVRLEDNRIFRSRAMPGFWLDVNWLVGPELADDYQCLQHLLASD